MSGTNFPRLACLLAVTYAASAAEWYVSPTGNDSASGSQSSPWATIARALSGSGNNDRILLQRGGIWRETFTIGGNRELNAYGSGTPPVVTASTVVTMTGTWVSNAQIRTASVAAEARSLWVDGVFQPLARYPNSGFLNTTMGTTLNQIRGSGLPSRASGRWTDAQVRWHRWHWFWETRSITSDTGGTDLNLATQALNEDGSTSGLAETGLVGIPSGFFIDKDLDELDAPGEWFSSASQLFVYPPAGVSGSSMTVEAAFNNNVITVNGATIRGISFRRFHAGAMSVNSSSTIENCTFSEIGGTALATSYDSSPCVIRRCIFQDVRNSGVSITQNPSGSAALIERNLFQRIGVQRGYGGSGTWHHVGIMANVGIIDARLNRIIDTGYAGMLLGNTPGNTAIRNVIVRPMSTSNDGAGIYTYKGPNTMSENIILDSRGDQTAAEPFFPFGNGIWPEFLDGIANSQITDNTIAGCNGNGIALINNFTCNISRNVLFDNLGAGLLLDVTNDNSTAQGHTLDDNVFATLATTRRLPVEGNLASWYNSSTPSVGLSYYNTANVDFGLLRRSTFVTGGSSQMARGAGGGDPVYSTLPSLAAAKPAWVENSGTTSTLTAVLLINDTEFASNLAVPTGSWTRTDGTAVSTSVSIAAFHSIVLIGSGSAPSTPIYQTASGIDWRATVPTTTYLPSTTAIPGDLNGDGVVDANDLAILRGQFGRSGSAITVATSDVNADGRVDAIDLAIVTRAIAP